MTPDSEPAPNRRPLHKRLESTVVARVSPDRTRRATLTERLTVQRVSWDGLVKINTILEVLGKIATGVWVTFIATVVLGVDARGAVERAFNAGQPLEGLLGLLIILPTVIFLLLRSSIGYCRWRVQRELWRRDVERFERLVAGGTR
ncbi:MAG: hypothetical protein JHD16_11665 [Solirubrobacteraceae bacterium]|nr:hypothetical protein [Solirubrobacteraceae bacterium]